MLSTWAHDDTCGHDCSQQKLERYYAEYFTNESAATPESYNVKHTHPTDGLSFMFNVAYPKRNICSVSPIPGYNPDSMSDRSPPLEEPQRGKYVAEDIVGVVECLVYFYSND